MPFSKSASAIGKYEIVAGTLQGDTISATGLQAVFTGAGNDSLTSYSTYVNGYKTIPFLIGGAGNDTYNISPGSYAFIADIGGGADTVSAPSVKLANVSFAVVDGMDLLATDGSTGVIILDPMGSSNKNNSIEYFKLYEGVYTSTDLYNMALKSPSFLGYTTYSELDKKGLLSFSMGGLDPSRTSDYYNAIISNDGSVINSATTNNNSSNAVIANTSAPTYNVSNTYAKNLVSDTLTGAPKLNQNSYDAKFYNLGGGRYGVQQKGKSTIDEITGATSLQFQDQAISLASDVAATFNQVKGIDDVSGVVFRLYNAAFARLPDANGLENWINGNKSGGQTYASSALEFSKSQEFKNRYGSSVSDTQYVNTLYNNVLGRAPDAAGLAHYQGLLASGKDRGSLLLDFSESPENRTLFTKVTGLS